MKTRRRFLDTLARAGVGGATAQLLPACGSMATSPGQTKGQLPTPSEHFDLVVIGSGFGGTMTALHIAYTLDGKLAGRPAAAPLRILMLERGTWWTTPMETVQDKQVKTRDFLILKGQPTQEWSALNDYRGMFDLMGRCRYSEKRPQGLYEFVSIGKRGFLNLENDGVSVLRASGVGGGSLIYSKILIRPPESLFDDPRWPGGWQGRAGAGERREYYQKALEAVTHGVEALVPKYANDATGLTGPSNILTRTAPTPVQAFETTDPLIPSTDGRRRLLRIRIKDESATPKLEGREAELLDRARVFQTAISKLTTHYGTVDLSINDMDAPLATADSRATREATPPASGARRPDPRAPARAASDTREASLKKPGTNYCERHGRCNIGCLPGAGQ